MVVIKDVESSTPPVVKVGIVGTQGTFGVTCPIFTCGAAGMKGSMVAVGFMGSEGMNGKINEVGLTGRELGWDSRRWRLFVMDILHETYSNL